MVGSIPSGQHWAGASSAKGSTRATLGSAARIREIILGGCALPPHHAYRCPHGQVATQPVMLLSILSRGTICGREEKGVYRSHTVPSSLPPEANVRNFLFVFERHRRLSSGGEFRVLSRSRASGY